MAKYRIAWMPGDGVGNDVMEAARIVLDRMKFDAEYVPCDIGWKFWCTEGNALPDRTVKALKNTTCGLFGAITSKPQDKAKEELSPELKGKGLSYFSPIVGLRQLFHLHTNMRPCKSYPGNPLNYRGNKITNPSGEDVPIDQVVFRENTEGMYGGVEFFPLPESVYTALCANPKMKKWKDRETKCAARDRWFDDALFPRRGKGLPRHLVRRGEHRRHLHVDVQESAGLLSAGGRKYVWRHC